MSATCRSCGASVIWIKTAATGKPMPLDAAPTPDGNVVIRDGLAVVLKAAEKANDPSVGQRRFTSHFATCVDAASHRKKKPSNPGE